MASKEEKHGQRFEHFLREFLHPLLLGGDLHIGLPINREESEFFRVAGTNDQQRILLSQIEDARERTCLEWTRARLGLPIFPEDQATLSWTIAVYNLLFLSHPIAETWGTGGSLQRVADFTLELLSLVPSPTNLREALANHSLLYGLTTMYRTDIEVKWWVGKQEFHGTQPPRRLLLWKTVRRVSENRQRTPWLEFELSEPQEKIWRVMLQKSPLTNLILPTRRWPLELHESLLSLEDGDLWRGLCAFYLEQGFIRPVGELGGAFWAASGLGQEPGPNNQSNNGGFRLLQRAAQLFYHLCALGLYLRGDELLNQLAAQLSASASPEATENHAKVLLFTFAALFDAEQQRRVLRVPKELLPNPESPLGKSLLVMRDLAKQAVPLSEHERNLAHLASVI